MAHDPEKQNLEVIQYVPENLNGPIENPAIFTAQDGVYDIKRADIDDGLKADLRSDSIRSELRSSIGSIEQLPGNEVAEQLPAQRAKSKSSSTRSRPLIEVPRSERRGLLAKLTLVPEVEKPYNYKRSTKWFITFLVALAAAAAPTGSAILLRKVSPLLPKDYKLKYISSRIA
jgi:hypothetical protein